MKYKTLKDSEFFHFFNFHELKTSEPLSYGLMFKPGGFQENIDLIIKLNDEEEIVQASLHLDRDWIGNEESVNPFAKDISKSFIDALFPASLNDEFKPTLITSLWNLKGTNDKIICLDGVVRAWEDSDMEVKMFLNVYRGSVKKKSKKNKVGVGILMQNLIENDKNRLIITITFPR